MSTQFRRAATAAATASITVRARSLDSSSFQQLLEQHGHAVRRLQVLPISTSREFQQNLSVDVLQQLPNLVSLALSNSTRVFSAFWSHLPDLTGLTQLSVHVYRTTTVNEFTSPLPRLQHLKRLSLTAPHAVISSSEASAFSQFTALQQLALQCNTLEPMALLQLTHLEDLSFSVNKFTSPQGQHPALPMLLAQLPHLTQLQLSGQCDMPAGSCSASATNAAAHFTAITTSSSLQHLKLYLGLSAEAWQTVFSAKCQLPHLKSLELDLWLPWRREGCVCSPANFPGFRTISALQRLRLDGWDLDPEVLLGLPALQTLQLRSIRVQSAAQAAALMDVLPQLKQLRLLAVDVYSAIPAQSGIADPLLYASPSTEVFAGRQHLKLGLLRLRGNFWKQLFAAQRLLPYLKGTSSGGLNPTDTNPAAGNSELERLSTVPALASWMLVEEAWSIDTIGHSMATKVNCASTEELHNLVQSYPSLSGLAVSLDPAGVQLDSLAALTDLRELSLSHAPADTPHRLVSALQTTAELKVLHLWFAGVDCWVKCVVECSNRQQLQALTALTQLTRLVCGCCCEAACSSSPAGAVPGTLHVFEGQHMVSGADDRSSWNASWCTSVRADQQHAASQ